MSELLLLKILDSSPAVLLSGAFFILSFAFLVAVLAEVQAPRI